MRRDGVGGGGYVGLIRHVEAHVRYPFAVVGCWFRTPLTGEHVPPLGLSGRHGGPADAGRGAGHEHVSTLTSHGPTSFSVAVVSPTPWHRHRLDAGAKAPSAGVAWGRIER